MKEKEQFKPKYSSGIKNIRWYHGIVSRWNIKQDGISLLLKDQQQNPTEVEDVSIDKNFLEFELQKKFESGYKGPIKIKVLTFEDNTRKIIDWELR